MATLVCFHAHPDDESILTAGVMAQAADAGHRVVLVVATKGELGEVPEGVRLDGETLADRRAEETHSSAAVLGVARVAFLGYVDSGMAGEPSGDDPACFAQADVEEAARRLAVILEEESADVLTVYDDHGGYGHPDHVQVHRVGVRAAELAGTPQVYEATIDRDAVRTFVREFAGSGEPVGDDLPDVDAMGLGVSADEITTRVDVSDVLDRKRAAMRAHATQIAEQSFFLALPDDAFRLAFGTECFIRRGASPSDEPEVSLLDALAAGSAR